MSAQRKITVSQSDQCISTLKLVYYDKNDLIQKYDEKSTKAKNVNFFSNSNENDCQVTGCKLFNSDCRTEYDGG